jgi:hypothetical protein
MIFWPPFRNPWLKNLCGLLCVSVSLCNIGSVRADDIPPLPADAGIDQVLAGLKARGDALRDMSADVSLADIDQATADSTSHSGHFLLQNLAGGDGRVRVTFVQRIEGDRMYTERHEYTLSGGMLVDRDYDKKTEVDRQVAKPGEKINLLKLGQGPFPLPIGQDPAEVRKQFDVTSAPPAKDDPPDSTHLVLKPVANTDMAARFSKIDVWVDRKAVMPVRITSTDAAGERVETTDLTNIHLNQGLSDADFALPVVNGWDVKQEQ